MSARSFALRDALRQLPGPPSAKWPDGTFDHTVLVDGALSASVFAPRGTDRQTEHDQDELYLVVSGRGVLEVDGERIPFEPGHLIHVPARVPHRFVDTAEDLVTWVVFYGDAEARRDGAGPHRAPERLEDGPSGSGEVGSRRPN